MSLENTTRRIILASGSPRRRELLESIGAVFTTEPTDADETLEDGISPEKAVETLSARKAAACLDLHKGENVFIIAADTLVYLDGKIIGKPRDEAQATQILSALSASRHEVYTGFTLCDGKRVYTSHERTDVYFKRLSAEEISRYVATGEPMDKAGAYGVQGIGKLFVERVEGDFFGAMGLPICRVAMEARRIFGITL